VLTDATHKLDTLAKKLGTCVEKARPYYDARLKAKEVVCSSALKLHIDCWSLFCHSPVNMFLLYKLCEDKKNACYHKFNTAFE